METAVSRQESQACCYTIDPAEEFGSERSADGLQEGRLQKMDIPGKILT